MILTQIYIYDCLSIFVRICVYLSIDQSIFLFFYTSSATDRYHSTYNKPKTSTECHVLMKYGRKTCISKKNPEYSNNITII